MAKRILSFEQYVQEADRAEEIEKDTVKMGEVEDLEDEVEESPEEVEVAEEADEEEVEESEDEESEEEVEESEEEATVETKMVADMMHEMYEAAHKEAMAYEGDDYEEHTIESYMKENAALAAALATKAMESACTELREGDMALEMYEAACESMKESYSKKIDEMKEAYAAK